MADTEKKVVLLAEDEAIVRAFARSVLTNHGYHVLEASDGQEALDISSAYIGDIHLLLTDFRMPRLDGVTLASVVLDHRPGIKILVMSSLCAESDLAPNGVQVPVLRKPFLSRDLMNKIREILPN